MLKLLIIKFSSPSLPLHWKEISCHQISRSLHYFEAQGHTLESHSFMRCVHLSLQNILKTFFTRLTAVPCVHKYKSDLQKLLESGLDNDNDKDAFGHISSCKLKFFVENKRPTQTRVTWWQRYTFTTC